MSNISTDDYRVNYMGKTAYSCRLIRVGSLETTRCVFPNMESQIVSSQIGNQLHIHRGGWILPNLQIATAIYSLSFPETNIPLPNNEAFVDSLRNHYKSAWTDAEATNAAFSNYFDSVTAPLQALAVKTISVKKAYTYNVKLQKSNDKFRVNGDRLVRNNFTKLNIAESERQQFLVQSKLIRRGKYKVSRFTLSSDNKPFLNSVHSKGRSYKFMTHFGINYSVFLNPETGDPKGDYVSLFFIYHHFGMFGGLSDIQSLHIESAGSVLNYREGGFYLAAFNYLYLKAGLAFRNTTSPGYIAGLTLILPVVQLEAGYNSTMESIYASAGLNIPLNR